MVANCKRPLSLGGYFSDVIGEWPFTEWTGRST
jgi:hypothetical protein